MSLRGKTDPRWAVAGLTARRTGGNRHPRGEPRGVSAQPDPRLAARCRSGRQFPAVPAVESERLDPTDMRIRGLLDGRGVAGGADTAASIDAPPGESKRALESAGSRGRRPLRLGRRRRQGSSHRPGSSWSSRRRSPSRRRGPPPLGTACRRCPPGAGRRPGSRRTDRASTGCRRRCTPSRSPSLHPRDTRHSTPCRTLPRRTRPPRRDTRWSTA